MTAPRGCCRTPANVNERAALAILRPSIETIWALFLDAGLDRLEGVEVRVSAAEGGEGRNFAACRTDGALIVLSPDLIHLPEATVDGILAHEFGHAADFCYPARFVKAKNGALRRLDASPKGVPAGEAPIPAAWLREWSARDDDTVERAADAIAEYVTGWRIGYSGPCRLQTTDGGVPRPDGLR